MAVIVGPDKAGTSPATYPLTNLRYVDDRLRGNNFLSGLMELAGTIRDTVSVSTEARNMTRTSGAAEIAYYPASFSKKSTEGATRDIVTISPEARQLSLQKA